MREYMFSIIKGLKVYSRLGGNTFFYNKITKSVFPLRRELFLYRLECPKVYSNLSGGKFSI